MDTSNERTPLMLSRNTSPSINTDYSGIENHNSEGQNISDSVNSQPPNFPSDIISSSMYMSNSVSGIEFRGHEDRDEHEILRASYESLDYEISDNLLYQKEEREKSTRRWKLHWLGARRWIICFMIGILTGLVAGLIDYGVETMSSLKFDSLRDLLDRCAESSCMYSTPLVLILFNVAFVLIGAVLTSYVEPVAAGSGIPQIKCYLNGVIVPHVVRIKTLIAKVVGVVGAVAGGLAVGKEGPMIHSGAVIAAGVSQGRTTSLGFDFRMFKDFRSDTEKRDFVSAGAAAGVAAAFGAPVGGVLFSLEEGSSFWNQALVWRIFFTSMTSTMSLNIIQSYIKGHPWDLAYPGLINFGSFGKVTYKFYEILIAIGMGAFGGLTGALFNHINCKLTQFRMKFVQYRWVQVLEVLMVAGYTGCFAYALMYFSMDCSPERENRSTDPVQFLCPDGEASSAADLFFAPPESIVKRLFHSSPGTYNLATLCIFAAGYFLLACWTYGLSIPSGLFIPCLLVGAAWGRIIGIVISDIGGKSVTWVDLSFFSLVGAASQLGGIVRMTLSLTVILMEATSNVPLGLPVMISLIVAKWVGDQFNEGIYDIHIDLQGVPILNWEPLPMTRNLNAKTVMSHPVSVFRIRESVDRIIRILREETHNGFPVVEDYDENNPQSVDGCQTFGTFKGFILRSQLIMMLKNKLYEENPELNSILQKMKISEFNEHYPRYIPIQRINVSREERSFTMNLAPLINQSHYIVLESASYHSIFTKFRSLGLRHMVVINFTNQVIGIVTRKDLARFKTEIRDGEVGIVEKTIVP